MKLSSPAQGALGIGGQGADQLLFVVDSADMTLTTDQQFTKLFSGSVWVVSRVIGIRKSGAFNTACVGGIYTAAGKTGTSIIGAGQSWSNLTGANKVVDATIAAAAFADASSATPYLSLSTGNGAALLASIYLYGVIMDR